MNNAVKVAAHVHAAKAAWSVDVAQSWLVTKTICCLVHQELYIICLMQIRGQRRLQVLLYLAGRFDDPEPV